MSLDADDILEMKRAITLYDSSKNIYQDPNDNEEIHYTLNEYKRVIAPIINFYKKTIEEVIPQIDTGHLPSSHAEMLKKLIFAPSMIQIADALYKSQQINVDDMIAMRDNLIFDTMPDIYAWREAQTKKGLTIADIEAGTLPKEKKKRASKALSLTLGILLAPTD